MYKLYNGYVRAYKMIFAVLDRRLIQLLIKWLPFLSIIYKYSPHDLAYTFSTGNHTLRLAKQPDVDLPCSWKNYLMLIINNPEWFVT